MAEPVVVSPTARRPFMPGYGLLGPQEGTGLLPWSWAAERLTNSHDYWVATSQPDCAPHVMPVWGMWDGSSFWFSSSKGSRKARNLRERPTCVVTTDNPAEPVVLRGPAEVVSDPQILKSVLDMENRKYSTDYEIEMFDPELNACVRVRPEWAFGLASEDFTGSPTTWHFGPAS